ncbi:MAG: sortase [Clostridia bacterium]|nr:sortase [Clostridia bacterium]
MSGYKPVKIKRKGDGGRVRTVLLRGIPILLVIVISVCAFRLFDKRIGEVLAAQKYTALAERGQIDDPLSDDYTIPSLDWANLYNTDDPDGFDPLGLSPLGLVDDLPPSGQWQGTAIEQILGYTNKQATIWSLHDSVNSDISAWIYMYGMGINYPVAAENKQTDFYLTHSYDRSVSTSGTIFYTSPCKVNPLSRNLILHGHNMRDGTMFATLNNFLRGTRAFYDAHRYIFLDTLYGTYRYQVYSVYKCEPEDIYLTTGFYSNVSFINWCNETNDRGLFRDDVSFSAADRILTLSTCDATGKMRIIVHAKMVYPVPKDDIESSVPDTAADTQMPIDSGTETPTPSSTAAPTATPSPVIPDEPVVAQGASFCVKLSNPNETLRLRSGPGTTYSILGGLAHGTLVTILADGTEWVHVRTVGGMEGYLMKRYLVPESEFAVDVPTTDVTAPTTNLITPTPDAPQA